MLLNEVEIVITKLNKNFDTVKIQVMFGKLMKQNKFNNNKERLGVLIPGMGAVASTFICGVIACNK